MALLLGAAPLPPPHPLPRHRHIHRRYNLLDLRLGHYPARPQPLRRIARAIPAGRPLAANPSPVPQPPGPQRVQQGWLPLPLRLAAPALLFLVGCSAASAPFVRAWSRGSSAVPANHPVVASESRLTEETQLATEEGEEDDAEWKREFERWKSKTYALTVPLRIVALRGSMPSAWIKDFVQAQGKRLNVRPEFRQSLESIMGDLSEASRTGQVEPKSAMAADAVSIGDSWLNYVISEGLIEPIQGVEGQDWFHNLSNKWKVYLRRNNKGEISPDGSIWAAPYRWGCMVIAYKKNKLKKYNLAPIEDWDDLWRPELCGKIVMVDSPREVIGAVLKSIGASYNTKDIDSQVLGGMNAVEQKLTMFQRQVRLFDSTHYLKAFGTTDAWIAVGWSSDVLPFAKRMSNVRVIVPKSGSSLWADLWAIPATKGFSTDKVGGRIRGPLPLIHQWIEFCLQAARALPYQQGVIPGACPAALEGPPPHESQEIGKGRPKLDTNLFAGVPPPEILRKCEFLEPLSEKSVADYQLLITNMQRSGHGWFKNAWDYIFSLMGKAG